MRSHDSNAILSDDILAVSTIALAHGKSLI
jgi:hypothetical protein